jgi:hypothetical protein
MTLVDPVFEGMSARQRKVFLSRPANLEKFSYSTEFVYTFDFYQHLLNFSTFHIDLGVLKYDFGNTLGTRPIQVMAAIWDPSSSDGVVPEKLQYLYNFEIWHKRLMPESIDLLANANAAGDGEAGSISPKLSPREDRPLSNRTNRSAGVSEGFDRSSFAHSEGSGLPPGGKKRGKFQWLPRVSPAKPLI